MNIFLLEDNKIDAELTIRAAVKAWPGCVVEHATTMKEAMNMLSGETHYDVALLDMQLPDGNGMDALFEIRHTGADMAVVMLTVSGDEEVAVAALKAGADDYMVKHPGYVSKIPQAIECAFENHKQSQQRESSVIRVLYIEHNAADIDFTRRYVTRYAPYIRIKNVYTGEEALKMLPEKQDDPEKWEYHVLLMDYRLPGMTALEVIKALRQERKLDIPIIIITGQGNEDIAIQALKVGASEYLVKRENYLNRLPSLISGSYNHCELIRKQKALIESESKYRLLTENSGDVIFTLDFDLNYTYVCLAIYSMCGFKPEEVIGQSIAKNLTPASFITMKVIMQKLLAEIDDVVSLPEPVMVELEIITKDGTTIWAEVKASISADNRGNPVGILGVARDISKRKAVQKELTKLYRAVTQSPESIVITDVSGKIEYVNPKFTVLTGYDKEEVLGQNPRILNSGAHPESFYEELWQHILSGNDWSGEFLNRKKNGELYWESASISPLFDEEGTLTHFVAVKEDITQRKEMLEELQIAKEKAEESDRLKTAFINNISHEIRTPLNGILGFGQILAETEPSKEARGEMFKILHQSSTRLMNTISDYMNMAKIVTGDMEVHRKEFDLKSLFHDTTDNVTQLCAKNNIDFKINIPVEFYRSTVYSDPELVRIILDKLIDNAIKFTNQGSIICGYDVKADCIACFVSDTGCGIDRNKLDNIFHMFAQGDLSLTSGYEGSGLGLTIAKGLVTLLGGDITVTSELEKGSTFTFTIPISDLKDSETKVLPEAAESKDDVKQLVLIAEDDDLNYEYLAAVLDSNEYSHIRVADGAAAVDSCKQNPEISIVLMDIKMPVMNGVEATKLIHQFRPELPIIATTAYAQVGDRDRFLLAGCNDYLAKPIKAVDLLALIKKYNDPVNNA